MTISIEEFAEQGLQYPTDFATQVQSAFTTHAQVYGTHRDADLLDQSNWSVYLKELPPGDTDSDVYELRCTHWAVGWYTHLMVRVYLNPEHTGDEADEEEVYTPQFLKAYSLYVARQNYPVLDESDYSDREYQDVLDTLKSCYDVPEDRVGDAYSYLSENHDVCRGDDIRDSNVYEWYTTTDLDAPDWLAKHHKGGQA